MKHLFKNVLVILIPLLILVNESVIQAEKQSLPVLEKEELYVAFLGLPDGEATLIKTGEGKNYLINTGSEKSENELVGQLEELEVKKIDALLITKQTADYCENAKRVISRFNIDQTIHAGTLGNSCEEKTSDTKQIKWKTETTHRLTHHLKIKVLDAEQSGEMSLGIEFGDNSIMYLSNSNVEDEEKLLKPKLRPQILKIGDYGRGKSPSAHFLESVDPHISVIFNYDGDLPNEGLMERLNESWIDVYLLKQVGTTILRMNLNDYEILS
ncbi:ComEC/Rec2 family competence protein [Aquibacillus kalidii]|uniref:ComEC/Rec2 family competence protein n=1 Tax=Aquibacillus kalidii TaxID=2762597 RepID=UPI0016494B61|nr:hydrolase [Aquibacillus kalidii]